MKSKIAFEEAFADSAGEPLSTIEYRAIRVADERGVLKFGEADGLYKAVRAEHTRREDALDFVFWLQARGLAAINQSDAVLSSRGSTCGGRPTIRLGTMPKRPS